jgi:hypothetical protein
LAVIAQKRSAIVTASQLFSIVNPIALVGWVLLIVSVIFKKPIWRDQISGRWWPLGLSVVYSVLILMFFFKAPGGFDTLANVQLLFTSEWAALAGWIHYLAFDLFIGAWIAKQVIERSLSRLLLIPLLPMTFMFGPMGFVGFELACLLFQRKSSTTV